LKIEKLLSFWLIILTFFALNSFAQEDIEECTIAVISGKATTDGRPLLWKMRDSSELNNEVIYLTDGRFKYLALENAGSLNFARAGLNEMGFCIIGADSLDLRGDSNHGMDNGQIKSKALQICITVDDFETILKRTNIKGRRTKGNFGVIDAFGGAAMFEVGHHEYAIFDANDVEVAPQGYIVRTNFSMTGGGNKGKIRYLRANQIFSHALNKQKIDYRFLLRKASRDLADEWGNPYPIPLTDKIKNYPLGTIKTFDTINRLSTASAVVIQGVKLEENPSLTTFWVILGEPIFSIAIPTWVIAESVARELDGEKISLLCSSVLEIKNDNYFDSGEKVKYLKTDNLKIIWSFTFSVEDQIFEQTDRMLAQWRKKYPKAKDVSSFHEAVVSQAMSCIQELKTKYDDLNKEKQRNVLLELVNPAKTAKEKTHEYSSVSEGLRFIALGQALIEHDLRIYSEDSFKQVSDYLKSADVCLSDLEVAIQGESSGKKTRDDIFFHAAQPEVLDCLKGMGINMLALSNNHSWDLGAQGILETIKQVKKRGFAYAGTGITRTKATAPAYLNTSKGRVALISLASGGLKGDAPATDIRAGVNELRLESNGALNQDDVQRILESVREAATSAEYVFVYHHNHCLEKEYNQTPHWQIDWAHLCVDTGADAFIGHGPPILHGIEIYKGRPIFYSLGNFIFHTKTKPGHYDSQVWRSVIAECSFHQGKLISIKLIPIVLNEIGKNGDLFYKTRGAPLFAGGEIANAILKKIAELSSTYMTNINIGNNYAELNLK
jgi:poly-gamma-glutamate synthesis protein (capsule biosynthesis protein)